ncbi:hypothetical protein C8Q76DRAFT_795459 [Earliella scabrosa]|nr:hypothetical protein C8Q76DRAFT_795459 [Earliella scabrosa]
MPLSSSEASPSVPSPTTVDGNSGGCIIPVLQRDVLTAEPKEMLDGPRASIDQPRAQLQLRRRRLFLAPTPVEYICHARYSLRDRVPFDPEADARARVPKKNGISPRPKFAGEWQPFVHPEGQLYFRYKNFYTNAYLYDETNLRRADLTVRLLLTEIQEKHPDVDLDRIEIGLHVEVDADGDLSGCYYICDMIDQEVFWLEDVDFGLYCSTVDLGNHVPSREHLHIIAQALYWEHIEMFPHDRVLSQETLDELTADLDYYRIDTMTSTTSSCAYTAKELGQFAQIVNGIRVYQGMKLRAQHVTAIARLNYLLNNMRFLHYHGERYAQLERNQSAYSIHKTPRSSLWFTCVTPLLLFAPRIYHDRLQRLWAHRLGHVPSWDSYIRELRDYWKASVSPALIMLATNGVFLAVQTVGQSERDRPISGDRTVGQILGYVSTVFAVGNVVVCMILARPYEPYERKYKGLNPMAQWVLRDGPPAVERLAVMLSIPTALFAWTLLTFLAAVAWLCFDMSGIATRATVAVALAVILASTAVSFSTAGRFERDDETKADEDKWERRRKIQEDAKKREVAQKETTEGHRAPQVSEGLRRREREDTLVASEKDGFQEVKSGEDLV